MTPRLELVIRHRRGLGLGFIACLSGGCPTAITSWRWKGKTFWAYAAAFWIGLLYFDLVTNRFLEFLVNTLH